MYIHHNISIPKERTGLNLLFSIKRDLLGYFVRLMNQEGAFAWLSLGGKNILMINDAVGIQHVLKENAKNYHKSYFYKVLRPFLGNSILLSEDQIWRKQRQESSPVFTTKNFESLVPAMGEAIQAMFTRWNSRIERREPIDLNFETMWFTLDVLLRTLFHEARDNIAFNMQTAITTILREAEERVWAPISLPAKLVFKLPKYKTALDFLDSTIAELVATRRKNKAYPDDLLSRLIASYGQSTEEQQFLRDQVMTFLLAGHETTANGLVWACYYLSLHPEIMDKMAQEADRVLGQKAPTLDCIKDLVYTQQVFDEVLRIRPIVWTLSRDALADDLVPLENGDCIKVPKGTVVMACTYAVHRRDMYWKNPEAFDPNRFAPNATAERPRFAYFPFGGGPRLCLGFRFAQIESLLALAMIANKYELALTSGQDIKHLPNITLRPNGPILFQITNRKKQHASQTHKKVADGSMTKIATCPFHKSHTEGSHAK